MLPIPLLPAPVNMTPNQGYRIDIERLRNQRNIVFNWMPVTGANAYVFSLFKQTAAGSRRMITRTNPENRTSWTLENINELTRGIFVWQVEAVNINLSGTVEQRGIIGESTFIIDIPLPEVQANTPGLLYGN